MANSGAGGAQPQMATNSNVYQQASGAYNSALNGTQAAMGAAMNTPAAQARAATIGPAAQAQTSTWNAAQMDPARQLASTSLDPYMNPYQSQVVDQTAADMERARLIQQNQADDAMMQAGAFGGSRHGIANAETNRGFYDRLGATIGGLQHQGYQNAQNAAFQDISNEIGVNQYNTGQTNQASSQNAAAQNQTSMFNAGQSNQTAAQDAAARNQASMFNATQQNAANQSRFSNMLAASGQMSGLAGQGMGIGNDISDRQMRDGSITQGMQQAIIDAGKNQFSQFSNAGNLGLGPLAQFTSGNYGSSTTESKQPGLLDLVSLAFL